MSIYDQFCSDIFNFIQTFQIAVLPFHELIQLYLTICRLGRFHRPPKMTGLTGTGTSVNCYSPYALWTVNCGCRQPQCWAIAVTLCLHKGCYVCSDISAICTENVRCLTVISSSDTYHTFQWLIKSLSLNRQVYVKNSSIYSKDQMY